ncbi:MAG: sn-glycerol-1-phosphate dehydrogenase [Deltaproteobacteria bacterium]|nr:sn-glycerol-1-phosphate dehydrogenase [Deltaproteobacteria bacterium]
MTGFKEQPNEAIRSAVAQSKKIDTIVIEHDALRQVPGLLREHFRTSSVFLIADQNTMAAAGNRLQDVLTESGFALTAHVFPATPHLKGKVENTEAFLPRLQTQGGVPVAVGSGVINDLVKYAAFQIGKPYLSIATAASMDGYASAGSPLTNKGFKHTIPCAPPRVIVADLGIISNAPKAMSGWGYGDLAGKIPAGADWLIADALGVEKIDSAAWPLVQDNLRTWLANPAGVANGDPSTSKALFTGLVMVGIAMEIHGSSRPASGADHQIAHLWEMDAVEYDGRPVSHGTCVALGALTILSLYEWLLAQDFQDLEAHRVVRHRPRLDDLAAEIRRRFTSPDIAEKTLQETRAKYIEDDLLLRERIERIKRIWPSLRQRLADYLIPFEEMQAMLQAAGIATDPAAVGIDRAYHRETLVGSRLIRRRYTILDFLGQTGRFDEAVDHIFSAGGRWG